MDEWSTPVFVRNHQESWTVEGDKEEQHEIGEKELAMDEWSTPVFVCNHQESWQ